MWGNERNKPHWRKPLPAETDQVRTSAPCSVTTCLMETGRAKVLLQILEVFDFLRATNFLVCGSFDLAENSLRFSPTEGGNRND